jgi:hypothetical protein
MLLDFDQTDVLQWLMDSDPKASAARLCDMIIGLNFGTVGTITLVCGIAVYLTIDLCTRCLRVGCAFRIYRSAERRSRGIDQRGGMDEFSRYKDVQIRFLSPRVDSFASLRSRYNSL